MKNRLRKLLGRKARVGRIAVPLWALGLAMMIIAGAAGQAVGPVLAGSVTGSTGVVVEQSIRLDVDTSIGIAGADDGAATHNDEGTGFTIALETDVGQRSAICLYLENTSAANANAMLSLNVPAAIDVEVEEFSDGTDTDSTNSCSSTTMEDNDGIVDEAQLGRNNWLLTVNGSSSSNASAGDGNDDGLQIILEPKDDAAPGFYTITGSISQISG